MTHRPPLTPLLVLVMLLSACTPRVGNDTRVAKLNSQCANIVVVGDKTKTNNRQLLYFTVSIDGRRVIEVSPFDHASERHRRLTAAVDRESAYADGAVTTTNTQMIVQTGRNAEYQVNVVTGKALVVRAFGVVEVEDQYQVRSAGAVTLPEIRESSMRFFIFEETEPGTYVLTQGSCDQE